MSTYRLARTLGTCACCVSLVCAARAGAQTLYHVRPIGSLGGPGPGSYGEAINNHGQVVGGSPVGQYTNHPFLWDPVSGMIDLGFLPGGNGWGEGYAVNAAGHAAGWSDIPGYSEAIFWSPKTGMIGLGDLPGGVYFSWAFGINDLDEVVGYSASDAGGVNHDEAFLWREDLGMIGLGELPGGAVVSVALDINNASQVVGASSSYRAYVEAFLWDRENGMIGLGSPPGASGNSDARAINELGQVVGGARSADGSTQAFLWDPESGMISLGLLPDSGWDAYTYAEAINEVGQVVGRGLRVYDGPSEAFIWDTEHGMRSLNGLLGAAAQPPYDWVYLPYGINNAGQIVAQAMWAAEAVVLTPFVLGDMNCDGVVDAADMEPFALALVDYPAYAAAHPGCHGDWAGDTNQDAAFDARDIPTFIECLLTGCP